MNPTRHPLAMETRRGSALIIILSFVVLLTGLVMAFLMRSIGEQKIASGSANMLKVDLFAQSAADNIVASLKEEIARNSALTTITPADSEDWTVRIYYPNTPADMVPRRSGVTVSGTNPLNDPTPNLVRRSVRDDTLAPAYASLASAVSSTTPAANGRVVKRSRWNRHYLLPRAATVSGATDCAPVENFIAPDWVFVTGSGAAVLDAADRQVIGRYAYAIYDEGGLLDLNVAGHPAGLTDAQIGAKGSLAFADLAALTVSGSRLISDAAIEKLVEWRNRATLQTGTAATPAARFYAYFTGSAAGSLLTVSATKTADGHTDQAFTSRQSLIRFQRATDGFSPDALQYLTHFTRDLEQPTFRPDPNRPMSNTYGFRREGTSSADGDPKGYGGNDLYDPNNKDKIHDAVNPDLLTVRDDKGNPVAKRRFPLSRLALIKPNPSSADAKKIKDWFGLTWNNNKKYWAYEHGEEGVILTLEEVAALNREPDFFELLKASVNGDSIGRQHGATGNFSLIGDKASIHSFTRNAAAVDGITAYQIMRIGANLIDQYDADSYPTAIALTDIRIFYGVENLPYLNGWRLSWYHMRRLAAADIDPAQLSKLPAGSALPWETWLYLQPSVWNPHAPNLDLDTAAMPTKFRITAGERTRTEGVKLSVYPQVTNTWWGQSLVPVYNPISEYPFANLDSTFRRAWPMAELEHETTTITFSAAPNNTIADNPSAFREPQRLLWHYPDGSGAETTGAMGTFQLNHYGAVADPILSQHDAPADGNTVIGFFCGKAWAGPYNQNYLTQGAIAGAGGGYDMCFQLQYQNADGQWQTYDVIDFIYAALSLNNRFASTIDSADSGSNVRGFLTGQRFDPRTDRWGLPVLNTFPLAPLPPATATVGTQIISALPDGSTAHPGAGDSSNSRLYRWFHDNSQPVGNWTNINQYIGDLVTNSYIAANKSTEYPGAKTMYNDPDHVMRRAVGAYITRGSYGGLPMRTGNYDSRPVVLNRPFRSVAEMGYAFSDTPWKELSFFTPESGDAALLEVFCMNEVDAGADGDYSPPLVAGRVNLNTRQPKVLQAIISGVAKTESATSPVANATRLLTGDEARKAAEQLVVWTSDTVSVTDGVMKKGPLRHRSELVGKFVSKVTNPNGPTSSSQPLQGTNVGYDGEKSYSGYSTVLSGSGANAVFGNRDDAIIKRRCESVMRALADSGNTRVWNLLVDLIAQTGRFPANAAADGLEKFIVEGETHIWIHIAIDRFTGEIIAKQVEPVYE